MSRRNYYKCKLCGKTFPQIFFPDMMNFSITVCLAQSAKEEWHHCSEHQIGIAELIGVKDEDYEFIK